MIGGLLLQLIISMLCLTQASSAAPSLAKPGCKDFCGNVSIPYPFGIGQDCYYNEWFSINCSNQSTPFLSHPNLNLEVRNVSLKGQYVLVETPTVDFCKLPKLEETHEVNSVDLSGSPFLFPKGNAIWMIGCGSVALLSRQGKTLAGCSTIDICENTNSSAGVFAYGNGCTGIDCCLSTTPSRLDFYRLKTTSTQNFIRSGWPNCTLAAVGNTIFNDNSTSRAVSQLIWRIEELAGGYNCIINTDNTSREWSMEDVSYYNCSCGPHEEGNPYLPQPHGCQIVEACANCKDRCRRRGEPSRTGDGGEFFCADESSASLKALIIGLSVAGGSLFILLGSFWLYKVLKKRREIKLKQQFFRQNGGLLLHQQISSHEVVEKTKIFTSEELEKATDNFNANRILGQGGQGTVYKGMLTDGKIVAIKRSKRVDKNEVEQFINEIVILSQINHRNIVGLLGCCLETEVPLLVYEFISNGTLFQLIHDQGEFPFSWEMRLQVATEVAGALAYLHSASSMPIYHRDVKSANILLDDKYRAKVSDFGTSRSISIDQTHLTTIVQGTFGYLDPEYFQSSQFTEKSDVYSFGVVLAELLTGQKPISSLRSEERKSLATHFILSLEEDHLLDILDVQVAKEGQKEEIMAIANLANRCLNLNGRKRPTMGEVAMELVHIRTISLPLNTKENVGEDEVIISEISGPLDSVSTSTVTMQFDYKKAFSLDVQPLFVNTL